MSAIITNHRCNWERLEKGVERLAEAARALTDAEKAKENADAKLAEFRTAAAKGPDSLAKIGKDRLERMISTCSAIDAENEKADSAYTEQVKLLERLPDGVPESFAPPIPQRPAAAIVSDYDTWLTDVLFALPIDAVAEADTANGQLEAARADYESAKRSLVDMLDEYQKERDAIHEGLKILDGLIAEAKAANRKALASREAELSNVKKRLGE